MLAVKNAIIKNILPYFSNTGTILEVPYEKGMKDEVSIPYNPLATVSLSAEEVSR